MVRIVFQALCAPVLVFVAFGPVFQVLFSGKTRLLHGREWGEFNSCCRICQVANFLVFIILVCQEGALPAGFSGGWLSCDVFPCRCSQRWVTSRSGGLYGQVQVVHVYGLVRMPRCIRRCVKLEYFLLQYGHVASYLDIGIQVDLRVLALCFMRLFCFLGVIFAGRVHTFPDKLPIRQLGKV